MSPVAGTRLGPYEIQAPIGAGGMGDVYRAIDTRLDRVVAIKVSQREFTDRFQREATVVAALNHPNICHLYDVGPNYLVMEFVDGAPIAPGGYRKILDVAVQLASGLAAAHAAGIVHRDLKPDNVLITSDGRVKILDFGLAKQSVSIAAGDATQTVAVATDPGTILGTVQYMSPEQVRGVPADSRSDQFSFGLILYELAAGRRAFVRESSAQTMAAIIEAEPDYTLLAGTPAPFRWIVERCLAKDPRDRYDSTTDLYRDLEQLKRRQSELSAAGSVDAAASAKRPLRWGPIVITAALALATGAIGWIAGRAAVHPSRVYTITPIAVEAAATTPAWSHDGKLLAYSQEAGGYYQIFTRRLNQPSDAPAQLTTLDRDCLFPFWHPSGDRIYFLSGPLSSRELWSVGSAGGEPEKLIQDVGAATISPDGKTIVVFRTQALWTATAEGRELTKRQQVSGDVASGTVDALRFSPDGRSVGITLTNQRKIYLFDFPFQEGALAGRATTLQVAEDAFLETFEWLPDARHVIAVANTGTSEFRLVRADIRSGSVEPLGPSELLQTNPALSPDGSRIAYATFTLNWDIRQIDLQSHAVTPLVASARYDGWPAWTPTGDHLVFTTNRTGHSQIWWKSLAEGWERPIVTAADFEDKSTRHLAQAAVSPNGRTVAYQRFGASGIQIFLSPLSGGKPVPLNKSSVMREDYPTWSPDGNWIAFVVGNEIRKVRAGGQGTSVAIRDDALVRTIRWSRAGQILYWSKGGLAITDASGAAPRVVSTEQLQQWDWSADGTAIYAIRNIVGRRLDLVVIDPTSGGLRVVADLGRKPVTPEPVGYPDTIRQLAMSPDGKRAVFAYLHPDSQVWMMEEGKER